MSTTEQEPIEPPGLRAFLTEPDYRPVPEDEADGPPLDFDSEIRGGQSRFVNVGGVEFNRALPYHLRIEDLEPMARRREAVTSLRLELVKFSFTVLELPKGYAYEAVRIRIALDPSYPLMLLRPRNDTTQAQRTSSLSKEVQPLLSRLMQLDLKYTSSTTVVVTESRPVVTALDLNAAGFGWTYQAQNGAPISPGIKYAFAVLELPKDVGWISGTFDAEAVVTRRLGGLVGRRSIVPDQSPALFRIQL